MDEVREFVCEVSTYHFCVLHSQAVNELGKKSVEYSSREISKENRKKEADMGVIDTEAVEVPVTDNVKAIFVENSSDDSVPIFHVSD